MKSIRKRWKWQNRCYNAFHLDKSWSICWAHPGRSKSTSYDTWNRCQQSHSSSRLLSYESSSSEECQNSLLHTHRPTVHCCWRQIDVSIQRQMVADWSIYIRTWITRFQSIVIERYNSSTIFTSVFAIDNPRCTNCISPQLNFEIFLNETGHGKIYVARRNDKIMQIFVIKKLSQIQVCLVLTAWVQVQSGARGIGLMSERWYALR